MKTLFSAILFLSGQNLFSQVIQDWRYDNTISNPTVVSTDIVYDGENTYVSTQNFDQLETAYIQKFDSAGNLLDMDSIRYSYAICESRMVQGHDGSIYVCGQKDSALTSSKIKIVKLNSSLSLQWSVIAIDTVLADYYSGRICYSPAEDKIYVICQKTKMNSVTTAVLKFDTDGNFLWESDSIPSLGLNCIRFANDNLGNIILGGFIDVPGTDEDFTIVKIDTSGVIAWSRVLNNPLDDRVEDLAIDNAGNIYAFGYFSDAVSSRVVKYDSAGNFKWMSGINNLYGTKVAVDNSGIYVSGTDSIFGDRLSMVRLDSAGNISASNYTSQSASVVIGSKLNNSSELYVCYTSDSSTDYRWAVSKFDSSANLFWTFTYPDTTPVFSYPTSFYLLEDGFIISGLIDPFISTVRFREMVTTGIAEAQNSKLKYWPNPAKTILNFLNKENSNKEYCFTVYDINSRCILEKYSSFDSEGMSMINLPELRDGIYFISLRMGETVYSDRVVIMSEL